MTPAKTGLLNFRVIRYLRQKPQLLLAIGVGLTVLATCLFLTPLNGITVSLIAWNSFAGVYIILALRAMMTADHNSLKRHAHLYDDGEGVILLVSILAATLSFVAIVGELATTQNVSSPAKAWHVSLSGLTLISSWTYIHIAFAFHYAHGYYAELPRNKNQPSLIFPGTNTPLYMDFLYFAFVIGTSGQTADVDFATTNMRRIGLIHCVSAYLFNATVLALTINIAAGLISSS
jgi:uncharacterized membrane protein